MASLAALLLAALLPRGRACTYFELNTTLPGGEVVIGRTMEYGRLAHLTDWKVRVHPRGAVTDYSNSTGSSAHAGVAKYGFLALGFNGLVVEADGMNEAGLSIAANLLHRSEYQKWDFGSPPKDKKRVFTGFFIPWVLANFATVTEVREAILNGTYVVANWPMPSDLSVHWAVADAEGRSIVVEFERGEPKVYDNVVGVVTNDPFFPWHVENLNTYSWVSPRGDQNDVVAPIGVQTGSLLSGQAFAPHNAGVGYNTGGLPADGSPQSRFVKTFYMRQIAQRNSAPGDSVSRWLTLAQALVNAVFLPMGIEGPDHSPSLTSGYQAWATLRVPQSRMMAYRTYGNMQWKMVDLKKLDFTKAAELPLPSPYELAMEDVTGDFNRAAASRRSAFVV